MRGLDKHGSLLMLIAAALAWGAASAARGRCEQLRPVVPDQLLNVPPIPAEVMRPFTFGMRAAAADLIFIEAIQIFGARRSHSPEEQLLREDASLTRLLEYSTELDERFANVYWFAGTALPRHTLDGRAYGVLAAVRILGKGVRLKIPDWRLPFLLGFLESYYLGHMADAAAHVALAATMAKAPSYLGLLATRLAADAGELTIAEEMAETMAQTASSDESREAWMARRLDIQLERQLRKIEVAARRFRDRQGAFPPDVAALVRAGDLPSLPHEPHGGAYLLDPQTGQAHSTAAPRLKIRGRSGTQSGLEVH